MPMAVGRRGGPFVDINVTPMADVIIVLLIIFMVVVPLLSVDHSLVLPRAVNGATQDAELVVSVRRDGSVRIGNNELAEPELFGRIQARLLELPETARVVYVRADESVPYDRVERILDLSREAGAEQVALMTAQRVP